MIISRINGGLGNQMFQYAIGYNLAKINATHLALDINDLISKKTNETPRVFDLLNFNIDAKIANNQDYADIRVPPPINNLSTKIRRKCLRFREQIKPIYKRHYIIEPYYNFCPEILKIKDNSYISGVWQSEKYFTSVETEIRDQFEYKNQFSDYSKKILNNIMNSNSVSVHIRRGDYVTNKKNNNFYGTCSTEYYNNAIKMMTEKMSDIILFVFSDDMAWVKKNITSNNPTIYVSDQDNISSAEELALMKMCKSNIIANSSFSWWGAWLNNHKDKIVIAPQKWFVSDSIDTSDLIPINWIRL